MFSRSTSSCLPSWRLLLLVAVVLDFAAMTHAQKITGLPALGSSTRHGSVPSAKHPALASPATNSHSTTPSHMTLQSPSATADSPSFGGLHNAPSIYGAGVPPLIVPDTADAPFMQKSNLPEGTVFICVGAALGFLGMSVLAWRALVAWSLHRSVRRAAATKYASEKKSMYGGAAPSGYSSVYRSASVSHEHLSATNTAYNGTSGQRHSKPSKPPNRNSMRAPTNQSLFFSPTAGAGRGGGGNRASSYLPAGFYASGASIPASGSASTQLGGPQSAAYGQMDSHPSTPTATPGHQRKPEWTESPPNRGYNGSPQRDSQDNKMVLSVPHQRGEQRKAGASREGQRSGQRAPSMVFDEMFQFHTGVRERGEIG